MQVLRNNGLCIQSLGWCRTGHSRRTLSLRFISWCSLIDSFLMRYILKSRSNIQLFKQLDQCSRRKRRRCREIKINSNWVNKSRDSFTRHGRSVFCWKFISSDKCPKVRGHVSHYSLPQENVGLLLSRRLFGQHFHNCFVYRVESSADSQPRQKQEHNWIKSSRHPPRIDFVIVLRSFLRHVD